MDYLWLIYLANQNFTDQILSKGPFACFRFDLNYAVLYIRVISLTTGKMVPVLVRAI